MNGSRRGYSWGFKLESLYKVWNMSNLSTKSASPCLSQIFHCMPYYHYWFYSVLFGLVRTNDFLTIERDNITQNPQKKKMQQKNETEAFTLYMKSYVCWSLGCCRQWPCDMTSMTVWYDRQLNFWLQSGLIDNWISHFKNDSYPLFYKIKLWAELFSTFQRSCWVLRIPQTIPERPLTVFFQKKS